MMEVEFEGRTYRLRLTADGIRNAGKMVCSFKEAGEDPALAATYFLAACLTDTYKMGIKKVFELEKYITGETEGSTKQVSRVELNEELGVQYNDFLH